MGCRLQARYYSSLLGAATHKPISKTVNWAAPPFPDSGIGAISCCTLPIQVLVVGLLRSPVAECRMKALPIIADLDVPRNIFPCFLPRRVDGPVHAFDLNRGIE